MEGPGADASEQYDWLRNKLPVPIDYVVVVADSSSPRAGREKLIANLTSEMRVVSHPVKDAFIEAYQRTTEP